MGFTRRLAFAVLAVVLIVLLLKEQLPSVFEGKPVPGSDRSADIDFPVVIRVRGGLLEVASTTGTKAFSDETDPTILGQRIPWCREKSVWAAKYKITYRMKLGERWTIRASKGQLIARVPELEPSLPVAIDTNSLANTANEKCWFALPMSTKDRVLKRISSDLEKIATSQKAKDFARPHARKTVVEFIRTWAFEQKDYPDLAPDASIKVIFPGE
ncbi:hypothetical protein [Sphingobium sp. SA916]|uniref:hypothetical protein n=1 Tax=Sphingobium sp. SA916 TaxID=1851207 RepID=UPI000C9F3A18|nr:hypothetical protein [Sphingobium sp. SA916]PNP99485.1 hypothetical protein A8G00_04730 [Sphingobium sp. SA916]